MRIWIVGTILVFCSVFFFGVVQAAEDTPPPKKPQLISNPGEPQRLVFSDGRVAEVKMAQGTPTSFPVPFEVSENFCQPSAPLPKCHIQVSYDVTYYAVVWTQHPNPERIGQITRTKDFALQSFGIWTYSHGFLYPREFAQIPPLQLVCDDYSWLAGTQQAPAEVRVQSWSGETMIENTETGNNENRAVGGIEGVLLKRSPSNPQAMIFDKLDNLYATDGGVGMILGFLLGDVYRLILKPQNDFCSITLKPNLLAIQSNFNAVIGYVPSQWDTLLFQPDDLYRQLSFFEAFLSSNALKYYNEGDYP